MCTDQLSALVSSGFSESMAGVVAGSLTAFEIFRLAGSRERGAALAGMGVRREYGREQVHWYEEVEMDSMTGDSMAGAAVGDLNQLPTLGDDEGVVGTVDEMEPLLPNDSQDPRREKKLLARPDEEVEEAIDDKVDEVLEREGPGDMLTDAKQAAHLFESNEGRRLAKERGISLSLPFRDCLRICSPSCHSTGCNSESNNSSDFFSDRVEEDKLPLWLLVRCLSKGSGGKIRPRIDATTTLKGMASDEEMTGDVLHEEDAGDELELEIVCNEEASAEEVGVREDSTCAVEWDCRDVTRLFGICMVEETTEG